MVDVGTTRDTVLRGGKDVDKVPTVMVETDVLVPDALGEEDKDDGMGIGAIADGSGVSNEPVIWSILVWK